MKRFLLFSLTSLSAWVLLPGCSSSSGGGGAASCGDAGPCPSGYECQGDVCVLSATGGTGQGGSGQGGSGNTGTGGLPSGGTGNVGTGGVGADGGTGGLPSGGTGGLGGGNTGGSSNCGDLAMTTPTCQSCMEGNCCAEMNACNSSTTCYGLIGCIQTYCSTDPDIATCAETNCSQYADGVTAYNAVGTCLESYCTADCGG